jgi:predicted acylesterase/phospholipase RssA
MPALPIMHSGRLTYEAHQRSEEETLKPETKCTALVISGGGAMGAFAVGAVRYIFRRHRETGWFSIVGGCSTGALMAPFVGFDPAKMQEWIELGERKAERVLPESPFRSEPADLST